MAIRQTSILNSLKSPLPFAIHHPPHWNNRQMIKILFVCYFALFWVPVRKVCLAWMHVQNFVIFFLIPVITFKPKNQTQPSDAFYAFHPLTIVNFNWIKEKRKTWENCSRCSMFNVLCSLCILLINILQGNSKS